MPFLLNELRKGFAVAGVALLLAAPTMAPAQEDPTDPRFIVLETSERIDDLLASMEAEAENFPGILEELRERRTSIETADETIEAIIQRLEELTTNMEDGSEFASAIGAFETSTLALIAEAEGSNSDVQKAAIPELRVSLEELRAAEASRSATIVEARNVIRQLKDNRDDISFLFRAGQVLRATDLIAEQVGEFTEIVQAGRSLAEGLISAASMP